MRKRMKEAAKEDEANNKWKTSEAFISSIKKKAQETCCSAFDNLHPQIPKAVYLNFIFLCLVELPS